MRYLSNHRRKDPDALLIHESLSWEQAQSLAQCRNCRMASRSEVVELLPFYPDLREMGNIWISADADVPACDEGFATFMHAKVRALYCAPKSFRHRTVLVPLSVTAQSQGLPEPAPV